MDVRLQNVSLSEIGESVGSPPNSRFTNNVRKMGVVQPVLLAETIDAAGEIRYVIIDGNRRIHAARKAKLREIPGVIITDITDVERAQLTLVSNGFRSPNYLTEFWALKTLERSHFSVDDVMKISGMSDSVMATRQRLSHLQRELFIGLRNGKVSQANAITVAKMDRHDQESLAQVFARNRRLLKRDVDNQISEIHARTSPVQPDTIPETPPKIVTTGVRFVQTGQTDPSLISNRLAWSSHEPIQVNNPQPVLKNSRPQVKVAVPVQPLTVEIPPATGQTETKNPHQEFRPTSVGLTPSTVNREGHPIHTDYTSRRESIQKHKQQATPAPQPTPSFPAAIPRAQTGPDSILNTAPLLNSSQRLDSQIRNLVVYARNLDYTIEELQDLVARKWSEVESQTTVT